MSIGDWINTILCILSFLLAAISVVTVVITLKQNSKMIEESKAVVFTPENYREQLQRLEI